MVVVSASSTCPLRAKEGAGRRAGSVGRGLCGVGPLQGLGSAGWWGLCGGEVFVGLGHLWGWGACGTHRRCAVHLIAAAEDEAGLPVVHPAKHKAERRLGPSTASLGCRLWAEARRGGPR